MSGFDYNAEYQEYWSREDRWGSSSFTDAKDLASRVLKVAGGGSVLDVGCGMGELVHQLLRMGVDASGTDIASRCIDEGNRRANGRFSLASVLELPFEDASFDTVVCTDMLEHIEESDVPKALAELARVAKSAIFICLSTRADRDNRWHLTIQPRDWWEQQFLRMGIRKHSRSQSILDFSTIDKEADRGNATLIFEVMPKQALEEFPLEVLKRERDLHTDMLREAGRRSDAHVARYRLAAHFVHPNDRLLDVACGLGYGASILWENADPESITGVDLSEFAIEYANANFATPNAGKDAINFVVGNAQDLSSIDDASIDLVVSFETLEHLPDPKALIAEAHRVLTPGGRFIASVPNDWTDETGKDPNPEHLHVYHWSDLAEQVADKFLVEAAYSQIAGGGMKLNKHRRSISRCEVTPDGKGPDQEAEWWLIVGMKDPIGAANSPDANRHFEIVENSDQFNVADFARDYDNPWLVRSMVSMGLRAESDAILNSIATRTLDSARKGSPDEGAALCVLAYQALSDSVATDDVESLLTQLQRYHECADDSPHAWRWRVSNQYVIACLLLKQGRRLDARNAFEQCAAMDPCKFAPILATKTISSCFEAGTMFVADGEYDKARSMWRLGIEHARNAVSGDWINIIGNAHRPLSFGLAEACELLDGASRCSWALQNHHPDAPRQGYSWTAAQSRSPLSSLRWLRDQAQAKDWHESQHASWRKLAIDREQAAKDLQTGKEWLEEERGRLSKFGHASEQTIKSLRTWIDEQKRDKDWLEDQRKQLVDAVGKRDQTIDQLRAWIETQNAEKDVQERRAQQQEVAVDQLRAHISELSAWAEEQDKGKEWLDGQRIKLLDMNAVAETQLQKALNRVGILESEKSQNENKFEKAEAETKAIANANSDLRSRAQQLDTLVKKLRAEHATLSENHYALLDQLAVALRPHFGVRKKVRDIVESAAHLETQQNGQDTAESQASHSSQIGETRDLNETAEDNSR